MHISPLGQALVPCKINTVFTKDSESPVCGLGYECDLDSKRQKSTTEYYSYKMTNVTKYHKKAGLFSLSIQHKPSIQHQPLGFTEIDLFITISITHQHYMK